VNIKKGKGKSGVNHSKKKGLQLGKKKNQQKKESFAKNSPDKSNQEIEKKIETLALEEDEEKFNPLSDSAVIECLELLSCQVDSEGKVNQFEIKGSLNFRIMNPAIKCIAIKTSCKESKGVSLRVPPQFNKKKWTDEGIIVPKDEKEQFKLKSDISVLKYKYSEQYTNRSPFLLQFWYNTNSIS